MEGTNHSIVLKQSVLAAVAGSAVVLTAGYFFVIKPLQDELLEQRRQTEKAKNDNSLKPPSNGGGHRRNPSDTGLTAIPLRQAKDAQYWPDASTLNPGQLFNFLLERNKLFVDGHFYLPDLSAKRRRHVADKGQFPPVAIVSCADSRVPPEYLFGAGVGDLFLVRAAGNAIDRVALGSLEFAVEKLKVKLIIILGHSQCGAVAAAVSHAKDEAKDGKADVNAAPVVERADQHSLWSVVESCLLPAREAVLEADPDCSENTTNDDAVARNVKHQANVIWTNSKALREASRSKKIAIRCARSFIRTGQVFEIAHVARKDQRSLLAPPKPLFTAPEDAVLPDD